MIRTLPSYSTASELRHPQVSLDQVVRKVEVAKQQTRVLLDGVSWVLHAGQRVAVLSRNLAQADAFVSCAAGVASVHAGKVEIDAHVSWPMGQQQALLGILTARQNASFLQRIYGSKANRKDELEQIRYLSDFEDNLFDLPMNSYSKAMKARFRLALSLCFNFDVFIVPKLEAWSFRSSSIRAQRFRQAFEFATAGKTLLVSNPDEAFQNAYCSEGLVLEDARLAFEGDLEACRAWLKGRSPQPKTGAKLSL